MKPLIVKPHGLKNIDFSSLKSMLQLSRGLLNHAWEIADIADADLHLYSLETEEGQSAWQHHSTGLSAILETNNEARHAADLILKKPLRTKNFADVLNDAERKNKFNLEALKLAELPSKNAGEVKPLTKKVKKASLFSTLSQTFSSSAKKSPAKDLPALNLYTPEADDIEQAELITDPKKLKEWIASLNFHDVESAVFALIIKIKPLNRINISTDQRLALLETIKVPLFQLVFNRDITEIKREASSPAAYLKSMKVLSSLLEEIVYGYKLIVTELYNSGTKPNKSDLFLLSIIRTSELYSLLIVHRYRHYKAEPISALNELHQLFIYCEASNTLKKIVKYSSYTASKPFYNYYCQVILTGIGDPYSLPKYDVLRLFKLMEVVADKVNIINIHNQQDESNVNTRHTGTFCIDCNGDQLPSSYSKASDELLDSKDMRVFNTEGVLKAIEAIFNKYADANRGYDLDLQLLKKIIPQINSSYQRKYKRLAPAQKSTIHIAYRVKTIHQSINLGNKTDGLTEWEIRNQDKYGMMLSHNDENGHRLTIGEVIGLFSESQQARLATIRWIETDNNDTTSIGIETYHVNPQTVTLVAENGNDLAYGLLIETERNNKRQSSIVVDKGLYSKNRILRMKHLHKTYEIMTNQLLQTGLDYEHFNFIVKSTL